MRIIITGTPGTGKTTAAETVSRKMGLPKIDIAEIVREKKLGRKNGKELEVDTAGLRKALLAEIRGKNDWLAESHLLCEMKLPADCVFILRCRKNELEKRMRRRGYGKKKIDGNLLAELLDYFPQKCAKNYPEARISEVDTSKRTPAGTADKIIKVARGKGKGDDVDFRKELIGFVSGNNR